MKIIKAYFKSFDSFILFLYAIRRKLFDNYHRFFGWMVINSLNRYAKKNITNKEFLLSLKNMLPLPAQIELNAQETSLLENDTKKILNDTYNLLGSGDVVMQPIDWHKDFKSGYRWDPNCFHKKYKQEGIDSDSDVKIPRELSRCHQLLKVALLYNKSQDEKLMAFCISQIEDWIQSNPLMFSINWGCTMDVGIRAVNWIWALGLLAEHKMIDESSLEKIKISLYQHGWFIYRNPEKDLHNNSNHYLSDLAGQIHLGLLFKNLKEPKKWLEKGKAELFNEIRLQILPTGMSYERSTNYHRLVLELVLVPILLLKKNGHEIPQDVWYRLEKMFEFIMYSLKPDGMTPVIGDQDDGRLLPFGSEKNIDYRYLLSVAAILFDRGDFKKYGNGFNLYCPVLIGTDSKKQWDAIADQKNPITSKSFPDAGFYIMRNKADYLIFNASGKGHFAEMGSGTHTHSDLLSFELYTQQKTFLVDPGTYVYTADAEAKMLFRSTKMHNTVTVDGQSQNIIKKEVLWNFERNAIPIVTKWITNENLDFVSAKHDGYARLSEPVSHERSVQFNKESENWIIRDVLTGTGKHLFEWYFHFDVGIDFIIKNNCAQTICDDHKNINIIFSEHAGIELRKEKSFVSKAYGTREESFVLIASLQALAPVELTIDITKHN
jgi:hypothetical protein